MLRSRTGFKPSSFDGRDRVFVSKGLGRAIGAPQLELKHPFPARDQRSLPCCVSTAVSACMEILICSKGEPAQLSALFHYYVARYDPRVLSSVSPRDGLKAAAKYGICLSALHNQAVFDRDGAETEPDSVAYSDACKRRLVEYDTYWTEGEYCQHHSSDREREWKSTLQSGQPVMMAFYLTAAYDAVERNGNLHDDPRALQSDKGHCVVVMGYDDERSAFRVKDSRGPEFADEGCWWLPYDLAQSALIIEAWTIGRLDR